MSASDDGANESYFFWRACQISGPPSRRAASIARSAQSCGDRTQSPPGGSQKAGARGLFTGPVTEAVSRGLTAAPAHVQQQFRIRDLTLQDKAGTLEQLDALLQVPALATMQKLGLHGFSEDERARRVAVAAVARWITGRRRAGPAPYRSSPLPSPPATPPP